MKTARFLCALLALLGMGPWLPAHADERAAPARNREEVWMAVSDQALDHLRGGFDPGNGLLVTFGISRALYVNGDLVTQQTLNFGRLNDLTPAQAAQLSQQMQRLNIVQIGPGNNVQPQQGGASFGTVIQNTLNDQHIVNQTVINASSNSLGMVKNLNLQDTMNEGLARAIGSR
ncbi:MAG: hypothetical protein EOP82_28325 [Variovorax sp.]|nr:MAG: hypothetical protein EOP82_28325 [Variovorax sp.]